MDLTWRDCAILRLIMDLKNAKDEAVDIGLDHHFISEIDNLIQTAEANRKEEGTCDHCKHAVWKDGEIFDKQRGHTSPNRELKRAK